MSEATVLISDTVPAPTTLAASLQAGHSPALQMHAGALTPGVFSSIAQESQAAITRLAVLDLGYRTRIRITGEDRLRWLNGMVSNAIQTLPDGQGNYNFILNSQGRILGDCYIYRAPQHLLLDTDRSQAARILAHLEHFIIMDDVELQPLDDASTGIGVIGPNAAAALDAAGLNASSLDPLHFAEASLFGAPVTLVRAYSAQLPRFELWFAPRDAAAIWTALAAAGAEPIGIEIVEALRVVEGTPRYGVDIVDRHLPQETSQTRALNFTKGCYLGQEIVERIRSRATVHRKLRQFSLTGTRPNLPADLHLHGETAAIGQLTSAASLNLSGLQETLALGFIRSEAVERNLTIEYDGGTATVLDRPPALLVP